MPQPDWPRAFWHINQEPKYSQMQYFRGHLASNVNFDNKPNPEKVMTEFSRNYFKNLF